MTKQALPLAWTKHLQDPKRREDFESALRNSTLALGRLKEILNEELRDLEKVETSPKDFEDPNWAYKQAYRNGQKSRLKEILNLLNFIRA